MKNSFSKQIKIPYSKRANKNGLDLSIKGCISRIISKNKNDSMNKETIDGSCLDTQTFAFNQDSLNNSKATINKNFSLGKYDSKLIIFSSLKSDLELKNRKFSKKEKTKKADEFQEKKIQIQIVKKIQQLYKMIYGRRKPKMMISPTG
jgi:hypothetical protein